jgi:hypothetical protein
VFIGGAQKWLLADGYHTPRFAGQKARLRSGQNQPSPLGSVSQSPVVSQFEM